MAAKPPSAGGRWWLQSWFPDWSGWYGAQELTEEHPPPTESSYVSTECEKALGNNTVLCSVADDSSVLGLLYIPGLVYNVYILCTVEVISLCMI